MSHKPMLVMTKEERLNRFLEKIYANSFWPLTGSRYFYFSNKEKAEKVTKDAREAFNKMIASMEKKGYTFNDETLQIEKK